MATSVVPISPPTSAPANAHAPSDLKPPSVKVEDDEASPVKVIKSEDLRSIGLKLDRLFIQYVSDRRIAELRWLRNERQYLGIYDPEVEKELNANRSKAYPRLTRVKCISVLSRLMSLMFPGNERNWEIKASPMPSITIEEVKQAVQEAMKRDQDANADTPSPPTVDYVQSAVQTFVDKRAEELSTIIDDQLQEIGGHQTADFISLNRKVLQSGVIYGLGLMVGPYVRETEQTAFSIGADGQPQVTKRKVFKPTFTPLKIWDFYPDMSAKTLTEMDGWFSREVMSRQQVRELAERTDFFGEIIKKYLVDHPMGNYRPQPYETELRYMGVRVNVNEQKPETTKYEILVWHGKMSGDFMQLAGVNIEPDKLADDVDTEIWMLDGNVIKCVLNPWKDLGVDVNMLHYFLFDEDDTSPVGFGLPNAIRDSQMAVSAATRMLLDNASVTCGPNLELNTDLLRPDQDLSSISSYKIWYREGTGPDAQWPAVKNVAIDAHLTDLQDVIAMFRKNADEETFVGPATGGDMAGASEPMRTAAGASMLRGDAALPFKDIVRSFDFFTQSVLDALVQFNKKFNKATTPDGDYNVIARGATSLIAKEVRALQMDQLVATLKPEEMLHVDERKLAKARFEARDMGDLLVSDEEATRRKKAQQAQQDAQAQQTQEMAEATVRKLLSDAFKNVALAAKNSASADATSVATVLQILESHLNPAQAAAGAGAVTNGPSGETAETGGDTGQTAPAPAGAGSGGGLGLPAPDAGSGG